MSQKDKRMKGTPGTRIGKSLECGDYAYTVIFYDAEKATLGLIRAGTDRGDVVHSIPIANFLTSSADLPIILTNDGEVHVKK